MIAKGGLAAAGRARPTPTQPHINPTSLYAHEADATLRLSKNGRLAANQRQPTP